MEFDYTKEQYLMQGSVSRFFQEVAGPAAARGCYAEGAQFAHSIAPRLAAQGVLGAAATPELGGSQLTFLDFALIFEAAGQMLLPYPLMENYVATDLLMRFGSEEQKAWYLPRLAGGEILASVAWGSPARPWSGEGVQALLSEGSLRLHGRRTFIPFATVADVLVVPIQSKSIAGTLVGLVDAHQPGVEVMPLKSLDGSYPLDLVELRDVELKPEAQIWPGEPVWDWACQVGRTALALEALGAAERIFAQTLDYVKVREQFGYPVGRFQAVKHAAADDYLLLESARVASRYAAWCVSEDRPEAGLYSALAKAYASDMARRVTGDAIQLHGGTGFTWDGDAHLYFKRAWRIASQLGTAPEMRELMAQLVIDGRTA